MGGLIGTLIVSFDGDYGTAFDVEKPPLVESGVGQGRETGPHFLPRATDF